MATIKFYPSTSLMVTKDRSQHLPASQSLKLPGLLQPVIYGDCLNARRRVSLHAHGEALAASADTIGSQSSAAPSGVAQVVLTREKGKNKKLMQALVRVGEVSAAAAFLLSVPCT